VRLEVRVRHDLAPVGQVEPRLLAPEQLAVLLGEGRARHDARRALARDALLVGALEPGGEGVRVDVLEGAGEFVRERLRVDLSRRRRVRGTVEGGEAGGRGEEDGRLADAVEPGDAVLLRRTGQHELSEHAGTREGDAPRR